MASMYSDKNEEAALRRDIEHYTNILAGGATGHMAAIYLLRLADAHAALVLATEARLAHEQDGPR